MKKIMLLFVSILFLTGCNSALTDKGCSPGFHEQNDVCVEDFDGEQEFESNEDLVNVFLTYNKKQELLSNRLGWNMFRTFGGVDMTMDALESTTTDKGSDDYSETNNQVEGVDEMDNVLTDGKYIYISNYNEIQIVLAYTQLSEYNVLSVVKEITFEDLTPEDGNFYFTGMYVDEDRFIVVGTEYTYNCLENDNVEEDKETDEDGEVLDKDYRYCSYRHYENTTHIYEYSKDDFELVNEYELSGSFVGSRKINDDLYFVTNEYIPFYYMNNDDIDFDIRYYLPYYETNGSKVELSHSDIMYVDGTNPTTFTTFYGINLETEEVSTEVVLGEGGYNIYVSTENIYLTGTKWIYNEDFITALEETDNPDEIVIGDNPYDIETSIVRIEIEDGIVGFGAEGTVPGSALDQFAMDENNGYVRIVTTTNNWWWWGSNTEINNRLMILNMDLTIVSTLEGLGKEGESVQSTRFVGDYAYVVTFLRTDPFYVIDVSDPENPEKLSELEIPGFSDYLQPIGEDYILGIGYGDNDGGTQGLKISLYDVSDKSNAVVASEVVYPYEDNGYMWTSTVYNHKDLLVSVDKGIIALPYTNYKRATDSNVYHWTYHTGILVLNLDTTNGEISERSRVEHSVADYHDIYVYKSKFIDNFLYTISSKFVKVSTLEDPENILKSLEIGESREYYYGSEVIVD